MSVVESDVQFGERGALGSVQRLASCEAEVSGVPSVSDEDADDVLLLKQVGHVPLRVAKAPLVAAPTRCEQVRRGGLAVDGDLADAEGSGEKFGGGDLSVPGVEREDPPE
ncbi:hypothetical protein BKA10_002591 [Microbacterium invictum]|uniref:Uncharacterized protein n=1 Tax=Microbacterium invictum TaxID=515415 RepID=A0AA40SQY2_9MICO|nr:hypothetical protein [Microbacterium invictum]